MEEWPGTVREPRWPNRCGAKSISMVRGSCGSLHVFLPSIVGVAVTITSSDFEVRCETNDAATSLRHTSSGACSLVCLYSLVTKPSWYTNINPNPNLLISHLFAIPLMGMLAFAPLRGLYWTPGIDVAAMRHFDKKPAHPEIGWVR